MNTNAHHELARRYGIGAAEVASIAEAGGLTRDAAAAMARRVAIALAPQLGWSSERAFREAEAWTAGVSPVR